MKEATRHQLSQNEILFYFTRAAVGAQVPFGIAEEFALWSVWMGSSGMDPAPHGNRVLNYLDQEQSTLQGKLSRNSNNMHLNSTSDQFLSALQAGCFVGDWLGEDQETDPSMVIENVDVPFLVAAAAGHSSTPCTVSWSEPECRIVFDTNRNWEMSWNGKVRPDFSGPSTVSINRVPDVDDLVEFENRSFCEFPKTREQVLNEGIRTGEEWSSIMSYFRRCLVPSSIQSRESGAGAGLVDTD